MLNKEKNVEPTSKSGNDAKPIVIGSATEPKPNPYSLVWYRSDWSESKTAKNNARYWEWEIVHNGFKCP